MYPEEDIRPYADDLHDALRAKDEERVKALGEELFGLGGMTAMHQTHRMYTRLYGTKPGGNPRLLDVLWDGVGKWMA